MVAEERVERKRRPEQESLFLAGKRLAAVASGDDRPEAWLAAAHDALRDCISAVEAQLLALRSPSGVGGEISRDEPRLIPSLDRLEAALARLLVDFWEARAIAPSSRPLFAPRLASLAEEMRQVADEEWDLLYEAQNEPGEH